MLGVGATVGATVTVVAVTGTSQAWVGDLSGAVRLLSHYVSCGVLDSVGHNVCGYTSVFRTIDGNLRFK